MTSTERAEAWLKRDDCPIACGEIAREHRTYVLITGYVDDIETGGTQAVSYWYDFSNDEPRFIMTEGDLSARMREAIAPTSAKRPPHRNAALYRSLGHVEYECTGCGSAWWEPLRAAARTHCAVCPRIGTVRRVPC